MNIIQRFVAVLFNIPRGFTAGDIATVAAEQFKKGHALGFAEGRTLSRIEFRPVPLPFTEDQLSGNEYGSFITPGGFASVYGECSVPAPSKFGYEMRALYAYKGDVSGSVKDDVVCHYPEKFGGYASAAQSDELVPVILVVLR